MSGLEVLVGERGRGIYMRFWSETVYGTWGMLFEAAADRGTILSCASEEEEYYRICQLTVLPNMKLFYRDAEITQGLSEKLWNAHVRVMRFKAMGEEERGA
jgi:hypothetical protein